MLSNDDNIVIRIPFYMSPNAYEINFDFNRIYSHNQKPTHNSSRSIISHIEDEDDSDNGQHQEMINERAQHYEIIIPKCIKAVWFTKREQRASRER